MAKEGSGNYRSAKSSKNEVLVMGKDYMQVNMSQLGMVVMLPKTVPSRIQSSYILQITGFGNVRLTNLCFWSRFLFNASLTKSLTGFTVEPFIVGNGFRPTAPCRAGWSGLTLARQTGR